MTDEAPSPAADAATLDALLAGDEDDALTFEAPWQARAFGIAIALREAGAVSWDDFQSRFIDEVGATDPARLQADVEPVYYECWLETLEAVLVDAGVVDGDELDRRTEAFAAGDRDSGEFAGQ